MTCGLVAMVAFVGCQKADSPDASTAQNAVAEDDHDHGEAGEHGGHVIEMGEQYCVELVADEATHTVTLHFLEEGTHSPVTAPITNVSISVFEDGDFVDYVFEAAEEAGEFSLGDEALCHKLDHAEELKARLKATIDGAELQAAYEHEAHGEGEPHDDH
jgi:hypothetical protein